MDKRKDQAPEGGGRGLVSMGTYLMESEGEKVRKHLFIFLSLIFLPLLTFVKIKVRVGRFRLGYGPIDRTAEEMLNTQQFDHVIVRDTFVRQYAHMCTHVSARLLVRYDTYVTPPLLPKCAKLGEKTRSV